MSTNSNEKKEGFVKKMEEKPTSMKKKFLLYGSVALIFVAVIGLIVYLCVH